MARTDTLPHFLTDVADAIRTKTGSSETIQASSFDTEIANISGGAPYTELLCIKNSDNDTGGTFNDNHWTYTPRINTKITVGDNTLRVRVKCQLDASETNLSKRRLDGFIIGGHGYSSNDNYGLGDLYLDNTQIKLFWGGNKAVNTGLYYTMNGGNNFMKNIVTIDYTATKDTYSCTLEDGGIETMATVSHDTFYPNNTELYLFGRGADTQYMFYGKIFYCQIWVDNILVRDFIPVLDNANRPCMYDKVTKAFFYKTSVDDRDFGYETIE